MLGERREPSWRRQVHLLSSATGFPSSSRFLLCMKRVSQHLLSVPQNLGGEIGKRSIIIHPTALVVFLRHWEKAVRTTDCWWWPRGICRPHGPAGLCGRLRRAPPGKRHRTHNPTLSISSAQQCPPRLFGHFGAFFVTPPHPPPPTPYKE